MSYRITCDGQEIYDPVSKDLILESPKMQTSVNAADSATWTIWPNHPMLADMHKLSSAFEITEGADTLFRGRLLTDTKTFYGARQMVLEGGLAYLHDSVIRPFSYPDSFASESEYTEAASSGNVVEYLLSWLLNQHNTQVSADRRLKLGTVTVTDPNNYLPRSVESPKSTWDVVRDALYGSSLGGYMYCRYESDGTYVDYVESFSQSNAQAIALGVNMVDFSQTVDGADIYTAILPQGATLEDENGTQTEKRLDITSLDDGDVDSDIVQKGDYLYSRKGVETYGIIFAPSESSIWEDVTNAKILRSKAAKYLASKATMLQQTITVKAADLHFTAEEAEAIRPYRNIRITSDYHGLSDLYAVTQMSIPLDDPASMVITIGDSRLTMTDANQADKNATGKIINTVDQKAIANGEAIRKIYSDMQLNQTSMTQTATDIVLQALTEYTKTSDYDAFQQEVENRFAVSDNGISILYRQLDEKITDVDGKQTASQTELKKYINFDRGDIVLSASDSTESLRIKNDRISFMDGNSEVAWISDSELHITNATIDKSLKLGDFMFVPRSSGNLSLVWAGGDV